MMLFREATRELRQCYRDRARISRELAEADTVRVSMNLDACLEVCEVRIAHLETAISEATKNLRVNAVPQTA